MIVYSQMEKAGTRFMLIFSAPLFLASLLVGIATDTGFGFFLAGLGIPLAWSYAYSKSLNWFATLVPARPGWQFLVGATSIQLAVIALLFWAVA